MKYLKNVSFLRVFYDFLASVAALGMAFLSRSLLEIINQPYNEQQHRILRSYSEHFAEFFPVFALLAIGTFALFGFYSKQKKKTVWKPVLVLGAATVPVLLFGMYLYFAAPKPMFSRGAMLFLWAYSLVCFAAPRILKYFVEVKAENERAKIKSHPPKNVLVVGGAGYVGSQLVKDLLHKGYNVRVLDSLLFGDASMNSFNKNKNFELVVGDLRNIETLVKSIRGMDAVVHLAGIVGDPACSLDDDFTIEVNLSATSMIAELCKTFGIQRLVFSSTCSVYGQSEDGKPLNETSELNPVSLYAKTKIASEKVLMEMASPSFSPTILRFATLFGISPRPRFDLVVNILAARAAKLGKINVFGGNQWRPFVHVRDISRAITAVLEAPISKVGGEIFNVGSNSENHKIIDLGKMVGDLIPGTEVVIDESKEDERNYNVQFNKLNDTLGVHLEESVKEGVLEIAREVKSGKIQDFLAPVYSNVQLTEKLLEDINRVDVAPTHHKKTSKTLLKQIHN